ncbi:hypothetical protein C8R44DRAFT_756988 [Mycena epipterygia]|nr:hypothetical protein C8R44DRAFT_756988 [Mycena epipterygia]
MVNTNTKASGAAKKKRSPGGFKKRQPTAFNRYMSEELARLKAENVEGQTHAERWKSATKSWAKFKLLNDDSSPSAGSSPQP